VAKPLMKGEGKMNINAMTLGLTPQEKETYFKHQEKRHQEEAEKLDAEKVRLKAYKDDLIKDILKDRNDFTYDELAKKPVRALERIW